MALGTLARSDRGVVGDALLVAEDEVLEAELVRRVRVGVDSIKSCRRNGIRVCKHILGDLMEVAKRLKAPLEVACALDLGPQVRLEDVGADRRGERDAVGMVLHVFEVAQDKARALPDLVGRQEAAKHLEVTDTAHVGRVVHMNHNYPERLGRGKVDLDAHPSALLDDHFLIELGLLKVRA